MEGTPVYDISESEDFYLYPNPVTDKAIFELPSGISQIQIFDSMGNCVTSISNRNCWEPDAKLANGLYFIRANQGTKAYTATIILMR